MYKDFYTTFALLLYDIFNRFQQILMTGSNLSCGGRKISEWIDIEIDQVEIETEIGIEIETEIEVETEIFGHYPSLFIYHLLSSWATWATLVLFILIV